MPFTKLTTIVPNVHTFNVLTIYTSSTIINRGTFTTFVDLYRSFHVLERYIALLGRTVSEHFMHKISDPIPFNFSEWALHILSLCRWPSYTVYTTHIELEPVCIWLLPNRCRSSRFLILAILICLAADKLQALTRTGSTTSVSAVAEGSGAPKWPSGKRLSKEYSS